VRQLFADDFTPARYDDQVTKLSDARITVRLNGELAQDDVAVPRSTTATLGQESRSPGPIHLQDHGDPLGYRNVEVLPK